MSGSTTLPRRLRGSLVEALSDFRVVILGGARQVGKTTLLRTIEGLAGITLDDPAILAAAREDPTGLLATLPRPCYIDEFQRAGEGLLLAIKQKVDADRSRGQFVLSGSANYLADRSVSETLAGRAGRLDLWPLSFGELTGQPERFVERLFDEKDWPPSPTSQLPREDVIRWILRGGYPEIVVEHLDGRARRRWFDSYVHDVVSREALRPLADVRLETELRAVLRLLCSRSTGELVMSDLARDAGINRETCATYVSLLEALYLITLIPAWADSPTTRAKRAPKILIRDSGLAADLIGADASTFDPTRGGVTAGALFENAVLAELHKQASWSERLVDLGHLRDRNGAEVDCIIEERRTGKVVGIEIKLTATPRQRDVRHLHRLRDRLEDRFTVGVLLHAGSQVLPLGDRVWALPLTALTE